MASRASIRSRVGAIVVSSGVIAAGRTVHAQPADAARAAFDRGVTAQAARRFDEAATAFVESARLRSDAETWFQLGVIRSRQSRYCDAIEAFERARHDRARGPAVRDRGETDAIAALEGGLPDRGASCPHRQPRTEPVSLATRWWFWTGVGVSVAGFGSMVGFVVARDGAVRDRDALCFPAPDGCEPMAQDFQRRANTFNTLSNVALAVGVTGAVTTVTLALVSHLRGASRASTSLRLHVGPLAGGVGAVLSGSM